MDKNNATGLILISLLLFTYFFFFSPEPVPPEENRPVTQENTTDDRSPGDQSFSEQEDNDMTAAISDSVLNSKYGFYGQFMKGDAREHVLENEDIKLTLSSKGGTIKEVILKNYVTHTKETLVLLDEQSSEINELVETANGTIDINQLYYNIQTSKNGVRFVAEKDGAAIVKEYILPNTGFELNYKVSLDGLDQQNTGDNIAFNWVNHVKRVEKSLERSRQRTTINYYTASNSLDYLSETSTSTENAQIAEPVQWVSIKQKFFNASVISSTSSIQNLDVTTSIDESSEQTVKTAKVNAEIPVYALRDGVKFYFGPNDYDICKAVAPAFEENVYLGWSFFSTINLYLIIPLFEFLENHIASYGIIILILVFIIKSFLFPLTYKSYISMAKMKVLKPEMDEMKEKYGDDMAAMQKEQMKLYSRVGVNPLSGCIPMLAQMPVFLALFNFFPNAIQLRQESFLWADDLSTYDSIVDLSFNIPFYGSHVSLFTLLFTLSQLAYTYYNNQINTSVQGPMKSIGYVMPVMFMFFFNNFSSGLTYYYFVSNIITVAQQLIIRRFVDDDKIRKILDENKKKNQNKKKSKFQQRLEDAMKTQEASKDRKVGASQKGNRRKK